MEKYQQQVMEVVVNAEKKVRVECLVTLCEEAMRNKFDKHEQLCFFCR